MARKEESGLIVTGTLTLDGAGVALAGHTHVQAEITDQPNITVGTTAPASPALNDIWVDTN